MLIAAHPCGLSRNDTDVLFQPSNCASNQIIHPSIVRVSPPAIWQALWGHEVSDVVQGLSCNGPNTAVIDGRGTGGELVGTRSAMLSIYIYIFHIYIYIYIDRCIYIYIIIAII